MSSSQPAKKGTITNEFSVPKIETPLYIDMPNKIKTNDDRKVRKDSDGKEDEDEEKYNTLSLYLTSLDEVFKKRYSTSDIYAILKAMNLYTGFSDAYFSLTDGTSIQVHDTFVNHTNNFIYVLVPESSCIAPQYAVYWKGPITEKKVIAVVFMPYRKDRFEMKMDKVNHMVRTDYEDTLTLTMPGIMFSENEFASMTCISKGQHSKPDSMDTGIVFKQIDRNFDTTNLLTGTNLSTMFKESMRTRMWRHTCAFMNMFYTGDAFRMLYTKFKLNTVLLGYEDSANRTMIKTYVHQKSMATVSPTMLYDMMTQVPINARVGPECNFVLVHGMQYGITSNFIGFAIVKKPEVY